MRTGQRLDAEIGLYDYRARAYSPTLGRFLQTDPIGHGDGLNLYAYVGNDPVNFRDPEGLAAEELQSQFHSGALAPGGLLFNQGVSSIGRGDYLLGGAQIAGSFAEAALAVATVGQGTALLQTTRTATTTLATTAATKGAGSTVVRTTRAGEKAIRTTRPDGSVTDISPNRVKEFVPNTHPNAPPSALNRVKFDNAIPGSKGLKRLPIQQELDTLKKAR